MPAGLNHDLRRARFGPGGEHRIPPILRPLPVGGRVRLLRILHRVIDDPQAVTPTGSATADTNSPHATTASGVPAVRRPAGRIEGAAVRLVVRAGLAAEAFGQLSAVAGQANPAGRVPPQVVGREQARGEQALGVPRRQHDHQPGQGAVCHLLQQVHQHIDVPVELKRRRDDADEVAEAADDAASGAGHGCQLLPAGCGSKGGAHAMVSGSGCSPTDASRSISSRFCSGVRVDCSIVLTVRS